MRKVKATESDEVQKKKNMPKQDRQTDHKM